MNSGGGSGGSIWINCVYFNGRGHLSTNGGDGNEQGGGGAGGRITVNYQEGSFHSDQTSAYGGAGGAGGAAGGTWEPGGAGVVYLYGMRPLNKNLRIDNGGKASHYVSNKRNSTLLHL